MKFVNNLSQESQGIFFAILTCFFSSILVALVRQLSTEFHIFFIVMVRNFFALVFFLPQILRNHNEVFRTKHLGLHIFRGLNGLASMFLWFYAVKVLPLSEAVSISFIVPILTTLAAVYFLKEKIKTHSWIGTIFGFVGILIILRPGFREFNPAYICSFTSVGLWVISNLLIKTMTKTEKPQTIVTYMSMVMFIVSIPIAFPYMQPIGLKAFFLFAALGLISNLTHICLSISYAKSDLSTVQPFDFTRLVFISIISYFAFGEIVDFWVIIGSMVILCGVIIVLPKRKTKKQKLFVSDPIDSV